MIIPSLRFSSPQKHVDRLLIEVCYLHVKDFYFTQNVPLDIECCIRVCGQAEVR
jgi:hypothetical protein